MVLWYCHGQENVRVSGLVQDWSSVPEHWNNLEQWRNDINHEISIDNRYHEIEQKSVVETSGLWLSRTDHQRWLLHWPRLRWHWGKTLSDLDTWISVRFFLAWICVNCIYISALRMMRMPRHLSHIAPQKIQKHRCPGWMEAHGLLPQGLWASCERPVHDLQNTNVFRTAVRTQSGFTQPNCNEQTGLEHTGIKISCVSVVRIRARWDTLSIF